MSIVWRNARAMNDIWSRAESDGAKHRREFALKYYREERRGLNNGVPETTERLNLINPRSKEYQAYKSKRMVCAWLCVYANI